MKKKMCRNFAFISLIDNALKNKGYSSHGQLAKEIGVSRQTIDGFLNGTISPLSKKFIKMCNKLELNPAEMVISVDNDYTSERSQNMPKYKDYFLKSSGYQDKQEN